MKRSDPIQQYPDAGKKLKIVEGLFNFAYKVKYYQLSQANPDWSKEKLKFEVLKMNESGCR